MHVDVLSFQYLVRKILVDLERKLYPAIIYRTRPVRINDRLCRGDEDSIAHDAVHIHSRGFSFHKSEATGNALDMKNAVDGRGDDDIALDYVCLSVNRVPECDVVKTIGRLNLPECLGVRFKGRESTHYVYGAVGIVKLIRRHFGPLSHRDGQL